MLKNIDRMELSYAMVQVEGRTILEKRNQHMDLSEFEKRSSTFTNSSMIFGKTVDKVRNQLLRMQSVTGSLQSNYWPVVQPPPMNSDLRKKLGNDYDSDAEARSSLCDFRSVDGIFKY
jgi:hypothetical protein